MPATLPLPEVGDDVVVTTPNDGLVYGKVVSLIETLYVNVRRHEGGVIQARRLDVLVVS